MASAKFSTTASKMIDGTDYEQDPRPLAVDAYTNSHLITPANTPYHSALEFAYKNSLANGLRDISVSTSQGKYLAVQAKLIGAKKVLEIGTLGGYSSIWFASAGEDVYVDSIEIETKNKQVAEENIAEAGLSHRITVHLGAALDVLPGLVQEVRDGKREKFDMVFIDADKENNLNYFDLAMQMVRSGACIYVDNVVRKGNLVNERLISEKDPNVMGSRAVVESVGKDDRVTATVIQTVSEKNYDGFLLAVVK
jgi:predicted O-methyltransferase YrrM